MDLQLTNKKALVTGSTAGIGYSIAEQLLREGAEVIVNGRTRQRVDDAITSLKKQIPNARVAGVTADFSKKSDIDALVGQIESVDILVNNVGIFEPKAFTDITDDDWFRFFDVNVMSGVRLSRHYLPAMLKANWGRIIFISSESSINIPDEMIHYGMTKTAQLAVSRGLAELTKGTNVTVNSVLPGPTKSEGVGDFLKDFAKAKNIPADQAEASFFQTGRPTSIIQRFATTEEVASLVTYVASPRASATNGAALRVDGGVVKSII